MPGVRQVEDYCYFRGNSVVGLELYLVSFAVVEAADIANWCDPQASIPVWSAAPYLGSAPPMAARQQFAVAVAAAPDSAAVQQAEVVSVGEPSTALVLPGAVGGGPVDSTPIVLEWNDPAEIKLILELAVSPQFIFRRQNPPAKKGAVNAAWHWIYEQVMAQASSARRKVL